MRFKVLDGSMSYQVDTDGRCDCGMRSCAHLHFARLVSKGPNTHLLFLLLSAMHKEVRRSDANRSVHYGGLIARIFGNQVVDRYVRKICLEETRSLGLLKFISQEPWIRSLPALVTSHKKWERAGPSQILRKARVYSEVGAKPNLHLKNPLDAESFDAGLGIILSIRKQKDKKKILQKLAVEIHNSRPSPASSAFKEVNEYTWRFYQWVLLLEEKFGVPETDWVEGTSIAVMDNSNDTLLTLEPYIYDLHTSSGKRLLYTHWRSIKPGEMLPGGLDLRFSGSILSSAWREAAFTLAGDQYTQLPWQAVTFSPDEWALLKFFDSFFYPDFYGRLEPEVLAWGLGGHSVPK